MNTAGASTSSPRNWTAARWSHSRRWRFCRAPTAQRSPSACNRRSAHCIPGSYGGSPRDGCHCAETKLCSTAYPSRFPQPARVRRVSRRRPTSRHLWIGLRLSCLAMATIAAEPPPPKSFSADYTLKRNGIALGLATRSLRPLKDGRFIYASATSATGVIAWFVKDHIDEHSIFTLQNGHIRPMEYVYVRHGGSKTRRVKLVFDCEKGIVTGGGGGGPGRGGGPRGAGD